MALDAPNNYSDLIWLIAARARKNPGRLAKGALDQPTIGAAFTFLCERVFSVAVLPPTTSVAVALLNGWLLNFELPKHWVLSLFSFALGPVFPEHYILEDMDKSRLTLGDLLKYYEENSALSNCNALVLSLMRLRPLYRYRILETLTRPKSELSTYDRDEAWLKAVASRPLIVRDINHGGCLLGELVHFGGRACFVVGEEHIYVDIPAALSAFLCEHTLGRARVRSVYGVLLLEWVELFNSPVAINALNALV